MTSRGTTGLAITFLCAAALAGCGGSKDEKPAGDGVPKSWYAALDKNYAAAEKDHTVGSVPELSMDDGCDIAKGVEIKGKNTEGEFGSGVSTLGSSGKRYVCSFEHPSVDLVLATFTDKTEYDGLDKARRAQTEAGNEQSEDTFTIGKREIVVVKRSYPTNATHIDYGASYLDPKHRAIVRLDIETTDTRGLITSYSSRQAAKDLAALLDKG